VNGNPADAQDGEPGDGLAGLARAIANLSADDRARLAGMLAKGDGNGEGNGR
jgi:hypothetical protein